jgi:hypothetical protein
VKFILSTPWREVLKGAGARGERDVQVTVRRRDIVKRIVLIDFLRKQRTRTHR